MASTVTPLNTPMLRSQTSSVLVPTWISTLGGGSIATTSSSSTAPTTSSSSAPPPPPTENNKSPSLNSSASPPPPPPPAYGNGKDSKTDASSAATRSPFFGSVGAGNQGGGRAAALSMGLASWRNAGPSRVSPGTSPSLGPAAAPNNNNSSSRGGGGATPPPPPPPSYSATVTTVSGTSNQSKKATIFCEIADQVYTRLVNEAIASSSPIPVATESASSSSPENSTTTATQLKERETAINTAKNSETGKYLNVIRIAGLGDEGKNKVSSAVTVACQTTLSEPSGRFFVFELAPVGSELWPSHHNNNNSNKVGNINNSQFSEQSTPISEAENMNQDNNDNFGGPESASSKKKNAKKNANKKSGGDQQQQQEKLGTSPNSGISPEDSLSMLLPSSQHEETWNQHRVVCIACPNGTLCTALKNKLEEVFCSTEEEKKRVLIDHIKRPLPVSCCLVVKASNSANRNHEAEIVPWGELMEEGALIEEGVGIVPGIDDVGSNDELPALGQPAISNVSSNGGAPPPPAGSSPNTAKPSNAPGFPGASSSAAAKLPGYGEEDASNATKNTTSKIRRVPAPFTPSYFRLLRNERGVFRNALFLRFPSQVKAEIAMMYLERISLCGRRIRVEHKKQSRSLFNQQVQQIQSTTGNTAAATASAIKKNSSSSGDNVASSSSSTTTPGYNPFTAATTAAAAGTTTTSNSNNLTLSHFEIIEGNINELIRRYDRDGFSYPKRLLSEKDMQFLAEIAEAHDLTFESGSTTVSVVRPRKSSSSSHHHHHFSHTNTSSSSNNVNGGTGGANNNSFSSRSPAFGSQTPPWAPQTPPLHPSKGNNAASDSISIGSSALNDQTKQQGASSSTTANGAGGVSNSSFTGNNTSFSERAASGTMTFRGLRHWKEQRQQLAEAEKKNKEELQQEKNTNGDADNNNGGGDSSSSSPPAMSLDAGSVTQKYIRCLDWQEAEKKGIAAWGSGRGRPVKN